LDEQVITETTEQIAEHRPGGSLSPSRIATRIDEVWNALISAEDGREAIAAALDVDLAQIHPGPAPFGLAHVAAGFEPVSLIIVGKLTLTYVVAPVLTGLAKDAVKERLTRLWRQVVLPAIREHDQGAIND
jgi:hypothetical protein